MSDYLLSTPHGWYFRIQVPKDVRHIVGKSELKKSLKTSDKKSAKKIAAYLAIEAEQLFKSKRGETMSRFCLPGLTSIMINRANGDVIDITPEEISRLAPEDKERIFPTTMPITVADTPPQRPQPAPTQLPPSLASNSKKLTSISDVVDEYCHIKVQKKEWTSKTLSGQQGSLAVLSWAFKNAPIGTLSTEIDSGDHFFRVVRSLPLNRAKAKYQEKEPNYFIENPNPKVQLISDGNTNTIMERTRAFWHWAYAKKYTQDRDVFAGLSIRLDTRSDQDREIFSDTDLETFFSSEVFTKKIFPQPFHYWVPIASLLHGTRLNELCQLELDDIKVLVCRDESGNERETLVFDINDAGPKKHLKNKYSRRVVPIHQAMLDLNFLEYVKQLREKGLTRLFPELPYNEDNHYAGYVSTQLSETLRKLGIKRERVSAHSLRHNFSTHLDHKCIPDKVIEAALGHARSGEIGRYSKPRQAYLLKEQAIDKVDFSRFLKNIVPW